MYVNYFEIVSLKKFSFDVDVEKVTVIEFGKYEKGGKVLRKEKIGAIYF